MSGPVSILGLRSNVRATTLASLAGKVVNILTNGAEGCDVDITRSGNGFGNPFALQHERDRIKMVRGHRIWLLTQGALILRARKELTGKVLGCVCAPKPCHGDNLLWLCGLTPEQLLREIMENSETGRSRSIMGMPPEIDWMSILCKLGWEDRSPRILFSYLATAGLLERGEALAVINHWQKQAPHWAGADKLRESIVAILDEIGA